MHQPEVALLDEVDERQPRRLILLGDRHDETQVGLHELTLGLLAPASSAAQLTPAGRRDVPAAGLNGLDRRSACFDRLRQADLIVLGEQGVLTDVSQVQTNEILVISWLNAIIGHGGSLSSGPDRVGVVPPLGIPGWTLLNHIGPPPRNPMKGAYHRPT